MSTYSKQTGQFEAKDPDGRFVTVYVYTDYLQTSSFQSGRQDVQGMADLQSGNGYSVNVLEPKKSTKWLRRE